MMNKTEQTGATKICFVAPGLTAIYSLLSGKDPKTIGGPDIHLFLLIKELIKHDLKLSIIVHNEGGAPVEYIDGIEVIKIHKDNYSLKILNIVLELFRIWCAMIKANARIYIHRGGVAGAVSPFCRLVGRKFICSIASDGLVCREMVNRKIKEFSHSKFSLGTFGNWLDIRLADVIVVQNKFQQTMLKKNFGKDSLLIKTPFPLTERGMPERTNPPVVLWVGAMADVKQPELFVKLAEAMPEARFQMIGGHPASKQELYNRIKESSKRISNFEFLGVIPFHEVNRYFSRASILANTSMFEGFPHAFIQAWMHYVPVVSLNADPDELICENNMGFHSKTFDQLIEDVKTLLKEKKLREERGINGRKYVESEHDLTLIVGEYIELFNSIGKF